jgi:hypothetical protein
VTNPKKLQPDFSIYEQVGDTLLPSDTCYALSKVTFAASDGFRDYKWVVGNPANTFYTKSFSLTFDGAEDIQVQLSGNFANQPSVSLSKQLTIYYPTQRVSPLVGQFRGHNTNAPNDTFTVSVDYWFGQRYPWWSQGAYSISNLPKGFTDTTQNFNGSYRPEITGIISSTGYKNMAFDRSGNIPAQGIKGYATIKRGQQDTLVVHYTTIDMAYYNATQKIQLIEKQFIGIRK